MDHIKAINSQVKDSKVDITIFMPCYNEQLNVENSLKTVEAAFKNKSRSYEILVVDDGSRDKSAEVIKAFMQNNPQIPVTFVENKKNCGLGFNYFATASIAKGTHHLLINGDNDVPVETIAFMIDQLDRSELVIAYPLDVRAWSRRLISKIFTFCVRLLSGTHLKYYNSGVIHKTEDMKIWNNKARGYGYQAEFLTYILMSSQRNYIEVPVKVQDRHNGHTKAFTLRNFISVGQSLFRILKNRIELKFFSENSRSAYESK